jgi:cytochrome c oxidase subunit 3
MLQTNRSNFQAHPFHLVSPSPWPLYTSISLLSLTTSAVLSFHGFAYAEYNLMLSLTAVILSMSFWWRDVIAEGILNLKSKILYNHNLNIARAISVENLEKYLKDYKIKNNTEVFKKNNNLGYHFFFGFFF